MAHGRADTPASDRLLAATLLALDGDGYRSRVDAAVSAGVYALIADLPASSIDSAANEDWRFDGCLVCSPPSLQAPWAGAGAALME